LPVRIARSGIDLVELTVSISPVYSVGVSWEGIREECGGINTRPKGERLEAQIPPISPGEHWWKLPGRKRRCTHHGNHELTLYTYALIMWAMGARKVNITLSADADLVRKARRAARRQGKSLNQLVREYMQSLCESDRGETSASRLFQLMDQAMGDMKGRRFNRDEIHDR
jgi:hypothetical protein